MTAQQYLIIDYETYSEADLKKVGGYEYACHPSTEILCAAWTLGTRGGKWSKVECNNWDDFHELVKIMIDNRIIKVAHNAIFEQSITRHVLGRRWSAVKNIPPEEFMCTAAMAASHALPRNLEGACLSLDLPIKKDMEGRKLILKWCKPRKPTKNNASTRHTHPIELRRIMEYCATDVEAERLLFERLPLLNPIERRVWCLDQKINFKGFAVDRPLVDAVLGMVETETKNLTDELVERTDGRVRTANERVKILAEIEKLGIYLMDLRAKTVKDTLDAGLGNENARRLLYIRQSVSKTSTAKYAAFEQRSRIDGRCRDILVYHAASTGRWGGAGVQPQNFPRGTIKNTDLACEIIRTGDLELVRICYDDPMSAFSSALRGVIVPTKGTELFCADYAAIETRVLFWIANHEEGLNAFRENRDLYKEMAAIIYGVKIGDVTTLMRQLGKAAVLGCGYQMGAKKFVESCKLQRIDVEEDTAKSAVKAYRETHWPVVDLWSTIAETAIRAVQHPGVRYRANHTMWFVEDDFLFCQLPSGRRLAYYKPEVRWEPTPWGEDRPKLYHYSVNPLSKKWELAATYGGKLVENVVQAVARDLMAEAMLRIDEAGFEIVLSVHDEVVAEAPIKMNRPVHEFENLMATNPKWAAGMPVKVEGWKGMRYRK